MTDSSNPDENIYADSLDGFSDQGPAGDTVDGEAYEDMIDQGFSPNDYYKSVERFDNEHETIEDRFIEEEPDDQPDSGYGPPAGEGIADPPTDFARAGRLVAPDEGVEEDTESELIASDDGFAGGGSSAEEAAMHYTGDEESFETETLPPEDLDI